MDEHVLLVEDNVENRNIFSTILEYEGFRVVEAEDGQQAMMRAEDDRPDIVVLDLGLPGMDGFEVLRRMGADVHLKDVPILVVTAHVGEETKQRALALGARRFLTKPIPPRDLVDAVRAEI